MNANRVSKAGRLDDYTVSKSIVSCFFLMLFIHFWPLNVFLFYFGKVEMSFLCLWPGRPFFGWVRNTSVTLQKRLFWRGRPFLMICWMDGWWFLFMTLKLDIWRSKQNKAGDLVTITETCWVIANRLVFSYWMCQLINFPTLIIVGNSKVSLIWLVCQVFCDY